MCAIKKPTNPQMKYNSPLSENNKIQSPIQENKSAESKNFLVSITFPEGATQMSSLTSAQQEMVIRTVKDFRGGLYLDILNLSKRTSLLYVKAFHEEVKRCMSK